MIFNVIVHAPAGETFGEHVYDDLVGEVVTVRHQSGRPSWTGTLMSYKVIASGDAVSLALGYDEHLHKWLAVVGERPPQDPRPETLGEKMERIDG